MERHPPSIVGQDERVVVDHCYAEKEVRGLSVGRVDCQEAAAVSGFPPPATRDRFATAGFAEKLAIIGQLDG